MSTEKIGKDYGDSSSTVKNYIRLTNLIPELLQLVDDTVLKDKRTALTMGLKPAVELSYLNKEQQQLVYMGITYEDLTPSHGQALEPLGYEIDNIKIETPKIQADDVTEVSKFSAKWAAERLNKPVLKNDSGLFVNALNGFPGVYTHFVDETIGEDGLLKLMEGLEDRTAYFKKSIAYCEPNGEPVVFEGITKGTIDVKKSGTYGWSWDFVFIPDGDKTYFTLVTIIVGLLYRDLVKLANSTEKKKLPYEIDFILDEFANCPPLADIEAIVSVARSRGMHFHFFIQSFSQLDNVYGKEVSQIILDNCGLVYLKTNTQETAEAISKRLGKKTIESNSVRQSVSLMNYNGDRSTNLIGRDLMTPEEVKQLHYKTIIFPIIGFPIFRDTILYNKFSCYESGKVERNSNPLKNLSYTYFTVENINHEVPTKRRGMTKDEKEYYAQLELADKENLKPLELVIEKIFKSEYDLKYNVEANHRVHISVIINRELKQREKTMLNAKIKTEFYHTEIKESEEKTIINIYNENPNLSLGLRG